MKNKLKYIAFACALASSTTVALAASVTTLYINNGTNVTPLDVSSGTGVISNSSNPKLSMSDVSAIISTNRSESFAYVLNIKTHTISAFRKNDDGSMTNLNLNADTGGLEPSAMLLSRNTQDYAYVVNKASNTLSMFKVNKETGALTLLKTADGKTSIATGSEPVALEDSPDGKFLFAANKKSNNVSIYTVGSDGLLTAASSANVGTSPVALRSFKNQDGGQFLHVLNDGGSDINGGSINFFKLPDTGASLVKTQPEKIMTNGQHPSAMKLLQNLSGESSPKFVYVTNKSSDASRDAVAVFKVTNAGTLELIQSMVSSYAGVEHAKSSTNSFNSLTVDPRLTYAYFSNPFNGTIASYKIESTGKIGSTPISINQQAPQESGGMQAVPIITSEPAAPTISGGRGLVFGNPTTKDSTFRITNNDPYPLKLTAWTVQGMGDSYTDGSMEIYCNNGSVWCVERPTETGEDHWYYSDRCSNHDHLVIDPDYNTEEDDNPNYCEVATTVHLWGATETTADYYIHFSGHFEMDGENSTEYSGSSTHTTACYTDNAAINGCD